MCAAAHRQPLARVRQLFLCVYDDGRQLAQLLELAQRRGALCGGVRQVELRVQLLGDLRAAAPAQLFRDLRLAVAVQLPWDRLHALHTLHRLGLGGSMLRAACGARRVRGPGVGSLIII